MLDAWAQGAEDIKPDARLGKIGACAATGTGRPVRAERFGEQEENKCARRSGWCFRSQSPLRPERFGALEDAAMGLIPNTGASLHRGNHMEAGIGNTAVGFLA
ncbi:hypothetical protein ACU4GD_33100 [Cupriavidus basilensis]